MFERILFPTDFSEVSLGALRACVPKLFEMGAKKLFVVHVIEVVPEDPNVLDKIEFETRKKLDELVEELKDTGINVEASLGIGPVTPAIAHEARCPSIEIVDKAACEMVDLIVMPSRGKHARRRMQIGSTARNVVRKSSVPVLVLKYDWNEEKGEIKCLGDCEKMFEKPLIALDLSPCSELVISVTRKFAEKIKKAMLYHVVDYGDIEEIEENTNKAKNALDIYAKKLGVESECIVDAGIAAKEILVKALELNSTMVVMGKVGRGWLKEILLGSTADEVLKEAKAPTLLVPCR
ncbi:MAG: universal stress protein [Archaeoglobales archaeon]|nr:MAG: universal stress protein [Archaeoglobales archaeon]